MELAGESQVLRLFSLPLCIQNGVWYFVGLNADIVITSFAFAGLAPSIECYFIFPFRTLNSLWMMQISLDVKLYFRFLSIKCLRLLWIHSNIKQGILVDMTHGPCGAEKLFCFIVIQQGEMLYSFFLSTTDAPCCNCMTKCSHLPQSIFIKI